MLKPLEKAVYRKIEWNLHHVSDLREAEKLIREEAFHGGGLQRDPGVPSGTSRRSDPTAIRALNLTDNKPRLWLEAINATYDYYRPFTDEGKMARLFYGKSIDGKKVTTDLVADGMKCSRRMVGYYRDWFVLRCAIYAAEKGLIRLHGGAAQYDQFS